MIDLNKCELIATRVANLLSTVTGVEEGTPMVHVLENGKSVVKPATGAANEKYAGCALGRPTTPTLAVYVDNLLVPASGAYTVTLTKTMSGSDIKVVSVAAGGARTTLAAGSASNAGEYSISNGVITVNSSKASTTLEVTYKYAITLQEAIMKYRFDGFSPINNAANIGTQGLIMTGRVYTSMFDITKDWHSITGAVPVTLGAGVYTIGGSGTTLDMFVEEVPSAANNGMLGLRVQP